MEHYETLRAVHIPLQAMLRPGDEVYKVIVTPATTLETTTKPVAWPKSESTGSDQTKNIKKNCRQGASFKNYLTISPYILHV